MSLIPNIMLRVWVTIGYPNAGMRILTHSHTQGIVSENDIAIGFVWK